MNSFASAFGKNFEENKDLVRIRSFEFKGHTFKVKVPLTVEYEAMMEKVKNTNPEKVAKYYEELTKHFIENKDSITPEMQVVFKDGDIEIQGRSMQKTAKDKVITENRITAMIQMLVPEEEFNMEEVTYEMIEELFPFAIQMELLEKISDVISPSYKESKGK